MAIIWIVYSLLLLVLFKEENIKLNEENKPLLDADHKKYQTICDTETSIEDAQNWRNIFNG